MKKRVSPIDHFIKWHIKIDFLEEQINVLENLKDLDVVGISVLLLKYQLIEFKLRQLITALDLWVYGNTRNNKLNIKVRTPKDITGPNFTLGVLKNIILMYQGGEVLSLQSDLILLVKSRNQLVHSLFEPGDLPNLSKEIELANDVLSDIKALEQLAK